MTSLSTAFFFDSSTAAFNASFYSLFVFFSDSSYNLLSYTYEMAACTFEGVIGDGGGSTFFVNGTLDSSFLSTNLICSFCVEAEIMESGDLPNCAIRLERAVTEPEIRGVYSRVYK